jgi:dynein heavy chain
VLKYIKDQAARMDALREQGAKFVHYQAMLKQTPAEMDFIDETAADFALKLKLWEAFAEFNAATVAWRESPLATIDVDDMGKAVQGILKTASRSEKALPGNGAATKLKASVEDFKGVLPVVSDLRNRALQQRHWDEISAVLGTPIDPAKAYTLGELLAMGAAARQPEISVVSTKAVQEAALEDLFAKKVTSVWTGLEFTLNPYKDSKEVFVLGAVDEVVAALDEGLVNINTILGSRYCAPIRGEVEAYQGRLMALSETLDEWLTCQKGWMYLETIFSAEDIKRQLPEESKRFLDRKSVV